MTHLDEAWPGVARWLESVRDVSDGWGRYRYLTTQPEPWALQASAMAMLMIHDFGDWDKITPSQRQEAADFILACQDPADALFKDSLETEARQMHSHTWPQVWGQRHGAALEALNLLGVKPRYPIPTAQFADLSKTNGRSFTLETFDWANPWKDGESWSRAIQAFLRPLPQNQHNLALHPVLGDAFDAIESEILDPHTGMPSRRMDTDDPSRAMAGLFKVMNGYHAVGRDVPHAESAIDFVLNLQHDDGEFGYRENMCINWDSVWVLKKLDEQLDASHRHDDIAIAMDRLADRLMQHYRKDDGGFSFNGSLSLAMHHSIRMAPKPSPVGDMLGTRMSMECLQYASEPRFSLTTSGR